MSETPDFGIEREFYSFPPEALGEALPEFTVTRLVGKGSMGIVYEARRKADGARIALKVLPPSLTLTERTLARFLREGRVMSRVEHEDIVRFLGQGHGLAGGVRLYWFAMEFVDGVTMQERLAIGPMPVARACAIAARVGRALQFAHERGVVHRDVKPGNVMLREGWQDDPRPRIAITDFGLARETGTGSMTESGAIVGTPMYMAPELVIGGSTQAGTLADVYSLGATLYTLVTGSPPFDGPTAQSVLKQLLNDDPVRPRRRRRDLPTDVEAVVLQAMARDPRQRYGSPLEMAEDLERFLRGDRVQARPPGPLARVTRRARKHPLAAAVTVIGLLLLGGLWIFNRQEVQRQVQQHIGAAENWLAKAAATTDELDRPLNNAQRRELLLAAVSAAGDAIELDRDNPLAYFVRAKARHRLRQFGEAVIDLDESERLLGEARPEVLHFRIDALRELADRESIRRLQDDLRQLLRLDYGPQTRTLAAQHLLELGELATGAERDEALLAAQQLLQPLGDEDPRAAILRARIYEASGAMDEALTAVRRASRDHPRDLHVHLQAALLYERMGLEDEARAAQATARLLGQRGDSAEPASLDLEQVGEFLGDVDKLLQALDEPESPTGKPPIIRD